MMKQVMFMKGLCKIFLLLLFVLALCFGDLTFQTTFDALHIWFEKLVPSLFVSMVLLRIMYKQHIFEFIKIPFVKQIFHMDSSSFTLVLCSIFLGFPSGAMFLNEAYKQNQIDKPAMQRLVYVCSFPAPGFIMMSCGVVIFKSVEIGFLMFLSQVLSGLVLLWLTRKTPISFHESTYIERGRIMNDVGASIIESGKALYLIGGYLMLFMSCSSILFSFLPDIYAYPFRILAEFSSGIIILNTLPFTNKILQILTSMVLSFGGFCVHMQVFSIVENCSISYRKYFCFRVMQSILSALILYCLLYI